MMTCQKMRVLTVLDSIVFSGGLGFQPKTRISGCCQLLEIPMYAELKASLPIVYYFSKCTGQWMILRNFEKINKNEKTLKKKSPKLFLGTFSRVPN